MTRRIRLHWMPAFALVALVACDESPTEPGIGVTAVTIEAVGDAAQLVAVNAEGRLPEWESLNPAVVTVTPAGMAVAVAPGTATVRATLGSRTAEGTVTVLPHVEVTVTELAVVTDAGGATGMSMQLKNEGGRGYYRLEYWKARAQGETAHQRIMYQTTDSEAPVGLDIGHQSFVAGDVADWVVVYSRSPHSVAYQMTGCARVDGGTPCPMP